MHNDIESHDTEAPERYKNKRDMWNKHAKHRAIKSIITVPDQLLNRQNFS